MDTANQPSGPLAGLKVLELGQLIAGPFAAKTLANSRSRRAAIAATHQHWGRTPKPCCANSA